MSHVMNKISDPPNVVLVNYTGNGGIKFCIRERSFIFKQLNMGQLSLNSIVVISLPMYTAYQHFFSNAVSLNF